MVAPTRVNEEAPQEPTAAGPAGSATAELTQAEAVVEDPAGPAADLGETAPAQAGPAEAEPAEAEPAQAEPARVEGAETGQASTAPAEAEHAEAEPAEVKLTEAKPAEATPIEAVLAEAVLAEAVLAEAGEPGLADGEENQAGTARGESRDVRPLAVVGIIVGVIALVGVAAGVLATVTHGFKPKTVVTYRPAAVFGLHPGQCVDAGSSSLSFTLVSCASPHDAEVFARFSLPAATWPGSAAVRQDAGDGCASRLSGYLNPRFATIGLAQEYVYPNHDAWLADQRTVVCEVSAGNGRLTGSVRAQG
jgi:hypothetical protein